MPEPLTEKQALVFEYIKSIARRKGYPPTVREIGEAFNLKSTSTVHSYMEILERKGYIRRSALKKRYDILEEGFYEVSVARVPVINQIAEGEKINEAERQGTFPVPADFADAHSFAVRADKNAEQLYIRAGDMMIVNASSDIKKGDVVAARQGSAILARIFDGDEALGKVVGLYRWY